MSASESEDDDESRGKVESSGLEDSDCDEFEDQNNDGKLL